MPTQSRVLVTGASGFLGKHLVNRLLENPNVTEVVGVSRKKCDCIKHEKFTSISCNLREDSVVKMMLKFYKPTVIYHLAANPLIKLSETAPFDIIDDNIKATQILCHHSYENTRFIYVSSASVYGNAGYNAACNEHFHFSPNSVYGITKMTSEQIIKYYKAKPLIFRPVAMIGKGTSHGLIFDIVRKLRSDSEFLELFGTSPGTIKPFVHADDAVAALEMGYDHEDMEGIYNISMPSILSVLDVANIVMEVLDIHKPIKWLASGTWRGDNHVVNVCSNKIRNFGWRPKYNSSEEVVAAAVEDMVCSFS